MLPATGSYILAVGTMSGGSPVDYTFRVTDTSDAPAAPSGLGTVQSGTLAPNGQQVFPFSGSQGQLVLFDQQDNNFAVSYEVRDPTNALVNRFQFSVASSGAFRLPASGNG